MLFTVWYGINPLKIELVLFTRRYKPFAFNFKPPLLKGAEIALSAEVKYLGIILDKKLTRQKGVGKL